MSGLAKINFHGTPISVIEKDDKQYVAMKPIVKAMGLDWKSQYRSISRDPVLNSVMVNLTTTGEDGKQYEMTSLPLNKLNGWLFKIDANRYKHDMKRFNAIITYQRECYDALYAYFNKGVAIHPKTDIQSLIETVREEAYRRAAAELEILHLQKQLAKVADFADAVQDFGEMSRRTGLPKDLIVRPHVRSMKKPHKPSTQIIQMLLPLFQYGMDMLAQADEEHGDEE